MDLKTGKWSQGLRWANRGYSPSAVVISQTKALLCGGVEKTNGYYGHIKSWIYDSTNDTLTQTGSSNLHKLGSSCAKLLLAYKGKEAVLCLGYEFDSRAEIYDIETGIWEVNSDYDLTAARSSALHFIRGNR